MDRAQGRSIKHVRPTDDCDVCEGSGVDFGLARFEPVRSAVRENILWSIVILCSHGPNTLGSALDSTIATLKAVIHEDKNVICVGYAMDALTRLVTLSPEDEIPASINDLRIELPSILGKAPIQCWEALIPAGLPSETVFEFGGRK